MSDEFSDDYGDNDEGNANDSNPVKQLRAHARKLEKDLKAQNTELEELREFRAESARAERVAKAGQVFSDLNLSSKQAALFLKVNGEEVEVTREAVIGFAREYEIADIQLPEDEAQIASTESTSFVPVTTGGTAPVRNQLTREQYESLKQTDFAAAAKAVAENRVVGFQAKLNDEGAAVTF